MKMGLLFSRRMVLPARRPEDLKVQKVEAITTIQKLRPNLKQDDLYAPKKRPQKK
jgi:hypothetical protein